MGTSGQVLGIVWYVCFVYIIVCLHFVNVNKENTLYGFLGRLFIKCFETWWMSSPIPNSQCCKAGFLNSSFVYVLWIQTNIAIWREFEKTLKGHQYGYQMKGLGLGSKNMLFVFRFSCLFTKKQKKPAEIAKIAVLQNLRFLRRAESD